MKNTKLINHIEATLKEAIELIQFDCNLEINSKYYSFEFFKSLLSTLISDYEFVDSETAKFIHTIKIKINDSYSEELEQELGMLT